MNTERTEELILEGIAREFVSKVQNLRKTKEFNVIDRINVYIKGDETFNKALDSFLEYIKNETLAIKVEEKENLTNKYDLNGHEVLIDIEKIDE